MRSAIIVARVAETVGSRSLLASLERAPSRREWAGLLSALALLAVLVVVDIQAGVDVTLTGTYAVAPFVAAVFAGVRATALVVVLMLAAAAISPIWNMNFGDLDYDIRLAVLALTAGFAVLAAYALDRARSNARGLQLLDAVGTVADGSLPLDQTLRQVTEAVVPAVADFCLVDALRGGQLQRIAVRVVGHEDSDRMERFLRRRKPTIPDVVVAPAPGERPRPNLWERMPEPVLREMSHDPDDLELLRTLGPKSAIAAPIIARGREVGALTIGVGWSGRRYGEADLRLAENLAGRVGLALDNAGLFTDLESAERRLDTVMSIVDEAVVLHDPSGELIYANRAASEMLGFATPGEAMATPTDGMRERFRVSDEDNKELDPRELVGYGVLGDGESRERVFRVIARAGREERWHQARTKPIEGADGATVQSVTVIEDVTAVKRAELGSRLLAELGERLAAADGSQEAVGALAAAAPELADRAEVLTTAEAQAAAPETEAGIALLRQGGPPREGSQIVVPVTVGDRVAGVLRLTNDRASRVFDQVDLELATEMVRRTGLAIQRARLADERSEVARVLQRGLLPPALPAMRSWEAAAMYRPAGEVNEVGGDFYDAFPVGDGWMLVVGDVVGRGAAAASLTALARHTIRTAGMLTQDPGVALRMLDSALAERSEQALCTVAIAVLPDGPDAARSPSVQIVSAGHPLPLRLRTGEAEEVGVPGPLLGAFPAPSWEVSELVLAAGDRLAIYTDGITEARGRNDRFGEGRLRASLAAADSPLASVEAVEGALDRYIPGEPQDDAALLVVGRSGAAETPRSRGRLVRDRTSIAVSSAEDG